MKPKPEHLSRRYGAQFEDPAIAAAYRRRPPYPAEIFDLILERLPAPSRARVLELGSGTGEIAIPLAGQVGRIDAVEPSAAMGEVAASQPGFEQIHWHTVTAETFRYPAVYDLVICAQSLHWLDWETVFPRLVGALDPQGWLILVSQSALDDLPWQADLKNIIPRFSTNRDYRPYDLTSELTERGLFEPQGRKSTWPVRFSQSIDDYIESMHARNGFSRDRMTAKAATDFDTELRELLEVHHPDGVIEGRNQAHVIWGKPLAPLG